MEFLRPKQVAIKCDFNGVSKQEEDSDRFWIALEREISEQLW
jgi:hypothetical protein